MSGNLTAVREMSWKGQALGKNCSNLFLKFCEISNVMFGTKLVFIDCLLVLVPLKSS